MRENIRLDENDEMIGEPKYEILQVMEVVKSPKQELLFT